MSLRTTLRISFLPAVAGLLSVWTASPQTPAPEKGIVGSTFQKAFSPATIGPGSVSMLTFTITNDGGTPVTDLAFTDTLPAGVTIATPAGGVSTCGGALTAPDGGGTISFADGALAGNAGCTIMVNVTSTSPGTHMNVSGDLTSSTGNSGPASADLTVTADRPGFTKSFSPSSVPRGSRSTLTFTIDNTANASLAVSLTFTDNLPVGMEVATPANTSTDCTGGIVTAVPGAAVVSFGGPAIVAAMSSCTVGVDVVATGVGILSNVSGELNSSSGGPTQSSGKAAAVLEVTVTPLSLIKSFSDDPVPPGGTATLEFTINNFDRNFSATGVTFMDDLDAALSGLVAVGLPLADPCGAGSQVSGAGLLTFTGGNLPPEGSCTFEVTLQVPGAAAAGSYPNTTSAISGVVDGAGVVGNAASDDLFVVPVPILTKEFTDDPVGTGGTVNIEFTITNTSPTSSATSIAFTDEITTFFPFPVSVNLPANGFCGGGSAISLVGLGADRQTLSMTGGDLAAAASCAFSVDLDVPLGVPARTYTNTTTEITATVDGAPVTGKPATDDLVVVAAPRLLKEFTDDPAEPGGTVTLEFTLTHDENALGDAIDISFTDDLAATLPGLAATDLPLANVCGSGGGTVSGSAGDTLLTFSGATLTPGEVCAFSVTLNVPGGAESGSHTNTTSSVMATVIGVPATGNGASGDLMIAGLTLTKEFTDDPVIPGGTVTLEFTIANISPTEDATVIQFFDNLDSTLDNLTATGLPMNDICGTGSSLTGLSSNTLLSFQGGNLVAGTSCTFSVTLQVPLAAASDTYGNTTSSFSATVGGSTVLFENASDTLTVSSDLLMLTKSFTDDPVAPGDTVTLEFTLTNLSGSQAAADLAFSDDLDAALSGLAAVGLPLADVCGPGSQISGTGVVTLTGGALAAGASCPFSVMLQVPASAALGTVTNTTSSVAGTIGGLAVTGDPATDNLRIFTLNFTKTFEDSGEAGGTVTVTFHIENLDLTSTVSGLSFSDDLSSALPGLVATTLPTTPCGAGSALAGTSLLTLTGGNLLPGGSCTFQAVLQLPGMAALGSYTNVTSQLFQAGLAVAEPASADLFVTANITNTATATADGAAPAQGQTTNAVQP
jgi:uncharacterized repeat protein (TIGR01451 family)